jgi:putative transposase
MIMRKPRELRNGARYHVGARINRKEMALGPIHVKALFLDVVKRAKVRYDFRIENFCVMGNHYHLVIQPLRGANLSRIMQWIMSVFAMAYNRLSGFTGHVWGERFFSRIIASLQEYLRVFTYIDENPVRASLSMVKWGWTFGGLDHHRRGCPDIVDPLPNWGASLLPAHGLLLLTERF